MICIYMYLYFHSSPTVVGMLWEVTDLEVDKVVSSLLALCVPSEACAPWGLVGKEKWSQGELGKYWERSGETVWEK